MGKIKTLFVAASVLISLNNIAQVPKGEKLPFTKIILSNQFLSEGVAVADVNKDGKKDVLAGYFWFEAPDWKQHEIFPGRVYDPTKEYSNSFPNLAMDVNQDGWPDQVVVDFPGLPGLWFENPKNQPGPWKKHLICDSMGIANESPAFVDIDKDGRLDILCGDPATRQIVWLKSPGKGQTKFTRYAISDTAAPGTFRFSHGIGWGDINKDGKNDIVVKEGWWEGPADPRKPMWKFHPASLGEDCSHMQVFDVNGDGVNDVVTASAHRLGIWWYEQQKQSGAESNWVKHTISESVSQTHATIMVDLNKDGNKDLIAGKRFLAHHGSNDPGTYDPSLLLWFESTPGKSPYWVEHEVDNDSGAGLNITIDDMNKDGRPDIIVANKKGVFVFLNEIGK